MKPTLLSLLCCVLMAQSGFAQSTSYQWADEVVGFSSQWSRKASSAQQVLGPPNVWPRFGESDVAWAPSKPNGPGDEYVRVRFEKPMRVSKIAIAETLYPGSIYRIILYDTDGKKHVVFEDKEDKSRFSQGGKLFEHEMQETWYRVSELKLILRTRRIPGMNQIDAIGIGGADASAKQEIREIDYEVFPYEPENLGSGVNSLYPDMLPMISPDGKTLYFARKYHPDNAGEAVRDDIWKSELQADGSWSKAVNIGSPLNNEHHNFVSWINPSGDRMLVPHDYNRTELGAAFRVSMSRKTSLNFWMTPRTLRVKNLYNRSEFTCLHMNNDGTVMLLAVELDQGEGGLDLYVSFTEDGKNWTEPQSLGKDINTAGMEGSVFLAADERTLYFSSNGLPGYGGYDMFLSRRLDDTWTNWSEPLNLGGKINSRRDEYYYTIPASGEYAYFSSEKGDFGKADIYRIKLPKEARPEPVTFFQATVLDVQTDELIEASLILRSQSLRQRLEAGTQKLSYISTRNAEELQVEAGGYFPQVLTDVDFKPVEWMDYVETDSAAAKEALTAIKNAEEEAVADEYQEVFEDIRLVPLKAGQVVRLDNVYFAANKSWLRKESQVELNMVADFLMSRPGLVVEIAGHTNGLPGTQFCNELSTARAKRVMQYLMEKGVNKTQLSAKGYGKTDPLATNETLDGRQKNQRVELRILKAN